MYIKTPMCVNSHDGIWNQLYIIFFTATYYDNIWFFFRSNNKIIVVSARCTIIAIYPYSYVYYKIEG